MLLEQSQEQLFRLRTTMWGRALLNIATFTRAPRERLRRRQLARNSVPREANDNVASQLFHVDPEGLTQVKFFINLFDVGEAEGPFTFIRADRSSRLLKTVRSLRRRQGSPDAIRYTDEEIAAGGGADAIITASGPSGAGVAIDTSRCLHLGSRVCQGSIRLCLYLQYCTTREPGNVFDYKRFRTDPVQYLAVAHSAASAGVVVRAPHETAS